MTQEEILNRLLANISDEFDKSVGSFFYDVQKPVSTELSAMYAKIQAILLNGFAATAEGGYLDIKVSEQGIKRKAATKAIGTVTITGAVGSSIAKGDKVASDTLIYTVTESAVIGELGNTIVAVECDTAGKVGNVPIGAINRFPVTLPGLTTVTNAAACYDGFDAETDEELRSRYFEKVSIPATSGSKYHYCLWAKEVDGVGDARCIPLWNGNGTVKVVVINSDKQAASPELIADVATHIEESRPIGASVTVESAVPLPVNISATLTLAAGVTTEIAEAAIAEKITDYLQKSAFTAAYISYAKIGGAILNCEEVTDYSALTVNGGTVNIPVSQTAVPVLGVITIA